MSSKSLYLGMRAGDLEGKPYSHHWNPSMAPLQPQVREALLHGPEAEELALPLNEAHRLLEAGPLPLENGYMERASGEFFVAVETQMPSVTGAMFEWWMGWHTGEPQRYKLWHPRAHLDNGTREGHSDHPQLSDRDKYLTTHFVTEYVGRKCQRITIHFSPAEGWFPPSTQLDAHGTTALVCGTVHLRSPRIKIAHLIHQIREDPHSGTVMRSRFWLGPPEWRGISREHWLSRTLGRAGAMRRQHGGDLGRDMLVHCGMEMNHLGSFLPALYADYHD